MYRQRIETTKNEQEESLSYSALVVVGSIDEAHPTHGADALLEGAGLAIVCFWLVHALSTDAAFTEGLRVGVVSTLLRREQLVLV